jgi:TonB family protein
MAGLASLFVLPGSGNPRQLPDPLPGEDPPGVSEQREAPTGEATQGLLPFLEPELVQGISARVLGSLEENPAAAEAWWRETPPVPSDPGGVWRRLARRGYVLRRVEFLQGDGETHYLLLTFRSQQEGRRFFFTVQVRRKASGWLPVGVLDLRSLLSFLAPDLEIPDLPESADANRFIDESPPHPLHKEVPAYPEVARAGEEEGKVWVRVWIDERGHVWHAEIEHSEASSLLEEAALDAALKWKFSPARWKDGTPVPSVVVIPFEFSLE